MFLDQPGYGASMCRSCAAGTYSNAGSVACSNCPTGSILIYLKNEWKSEKDYQVFLSCSSLTLQTNASNVSCIPCRSGTYALGATCVNCPVGSYPFKYLTPKNKNSTKLNKIKQILYPSSDDMNRYTSMNGSSVCESCSAGHYADVTGSVMCKSCAAGFYSSGIWFTSLFY